ncbi:GXWXG protein-domain-containing protein [Syncephalastrum racemosum]|uniref:GXWXG protein-domain-containing protein n=1 Tax=Syncephalastrum racemosum TaxID=13706 RepID=A0A1X2H0H1_SYNRA|nr:GXWXG protein-domain-containing protein [Syncephalastrum racemosum]
MSAVVEFQADARPTDEKVTVSTPEEEIQRLMKGRVKEVDVAAVFDKLKPVASKFMIGSWNGGAFDTGHPGKAELEKARWAGKDFLALDNVHPVVVYDDDGNRTWCKEHGLAVLREVVYRGVVSTCMIYDTQPILDHFRYVAEDLVVGAMDTKIFPEGTGVFYFYLTRRQS